MYIIVKQIKTSSLLGLLYYLALLVCSEVLGILVIVTGLTLLYFPKTTVKAKVIAICFLLLPFSVYLKNYVVFGTFSGTTWSAMNWANGNHISCKEGVASIPAFSPISAYEGVLPTVKTISNKYPEIAQLHEGNVHDIRIIEVNKAYQLKRDSCFSLSHSLGIWAKEGFWHYLESPSEYTFLYKGNHEGKVTTGIIESMFPITDFFNLPNYVRLGKSGKPLVLNLSIYTFLYPLIVLILCWNIRQLSNEDKLLLAVLLFFSGAYSFIDFIESNRMRVEIEPLWYFFGFKAFTLVQKFWQKKLRKNYGETLA